MNSGCAVEFLQDVTGPQSESLQALATARQLIVDGAENLQVGSSARESKQQNHHSAVCGNVSLRHNIYAAAW